MYTDPTHSNVAPDVSLSRMALIIPWATFTTYQDEDIVVNDKLEVKKLFPGLHSDMLYDTKTAVLKIVFETILLLLESI